MHRRLLFFMLSFCLALLLSAAGKGQATGNETSELTQASGGEKSALRQAADGEKSGLTQTAGSEKSALRQAADGEKSGLTQTAGSEKSALRQAADGEKSGLTQTAGGEKSALTQAADGEKSNRVQATGRLRLVGSSAMSELVILGEGKQWYIAKEDMPKLNELQQRTVTIKGEQTIKELRWANGRLAGKRRYLHNIKILNVE